MTAGTVHVIVQQFDFAAAQSGEQLRIELGLGLVGTVVMNAARGKRLGDEVGGVVVAGCLAKAIAANFAGRTGASTNVGSG